MDLTNAHVATIVRSLAGIKGWSTNALAAKAGEPTPNVRRYFWTGERTIPFDAVVKVAEAFGMSASELLRRAEQIEPEPFIEPARKSAEPPTDDPPATRPSRGVLPSKTVRKGLTPRTRQDNVGPVT